MYYRLQILATISQEDDMEVYDEVFPGNLSALQNLVDALRTGAVVAFTGAGTSMPTLPSWKSLVASLLSEALQTGVMDRSTYDVLNAENEDFLYVIDEVYGALGEGQTKIKVCDTFNNLGKPTANHDQIIATSFSRFMTLNYDLGLEMAHASAFSAHIPNITTRNEHETNEWISSNLPQKSYPILHWHGLASDTNSIILSGSDYNKYYNETTKHRNDLITIFSQHRCALIGFGFNDQFIEAQLNAVMQSLPTANRHFALIGVDKTNLFNCAMSRRRFISKYKLEVIFYPIQVVDGKPDHSALTVILKEIKKQCPRPQIIPMPDTATDGSLKKSARHDDIPSYRTGLIEIDGRSVYCEPNLLLRAASGGSGDRVSVSDVASATYHCFISAPHEFGLTNLGRRLCGQFALSEFSVIFREATKFPNYKKKLLSDPEILEAAANDKCVVVIDDFSSIDHRRLLLELQEALPNARLIALQRASAGNDIADDQIDMANFRRLQLVGLTRSDIRSVVNVLSPNWGSDITSTAVDRIYNDLLQLCIPLTPSNVIMYASVLCKDGSFVPVSRLHIVEKFVADALQRASDAYSESFNYINKVDVISEFCFDIFNEKNFYFDIARWINFCILYKKKNLVDFDHLELLGDLSSGKIIYRRGAHYFFKYRMFFSYFVGRRISEDPELVRECLSKDQHLELDGLVEVLCGLLPDCSVILTDITTKLEKSMEAFYDRYPLKALDFHSQIKWDITAQEDDNWKAISENVEQGPTSTAELDELKSSLAAERRTEDQKISIIKFIVSESSVAISSFRLRTAIENAKNARAEVKKSTIDAIIRSYGLMYEVATIFAPLIAERKYVSWNGFVYINLIEDDRATDEGSRGRMLSMVLSSLPSSIATHGASAFGSKKLGQVFAALDTTATLPIYRLLIVALILRSKPAGWLELLQGLIKTMRRDEMYLRHYLDLAVNQIKSELNTAEEVEDIKKFIASIRLRRDVNVKSANRAQIAKAIENLDPFFSDITKNSG